jgi:hypothetical protein
MIRQRLVASFVTATALVTLAACGSDAKSSTTTKAPATTAAATATTSAAGAGTTGAGSASATTATDGGTATGDSTSDSLVGNCVKYADEFGSISNAADLPDKATLNTFFDELSGDVPSDLKDDVATLKGALTTLYGAIDEAGGNLTEAAQDPKVQQALAAMNEEQISAAGDAMQKWFDAGCPG